jgi:hypothetical protein
MNTTELNMGQWTFNEEFVYMCTYPFDAVGIFLIHEQSQSPS